MTAEPAAIEALQTNLSLLSRIGDSSTSLRSDSGYCVNQRLSVRDDGRPFRPFGRDRLQGPVPRFPREIEERIDEYLTMEAELDSDRDEPRAEISSALRRRSR